MTTPIPGPTPKPIIGNIFDVQGKLPLEALERIVDIYGPIFKLKVPQGLSYSQGLSYFVGGFELFDELCDETRFYKIPTPFLIEGLPENPRGLFTAISEYDDDWATAHRVLLPAFGPLAIEGMFDEMHDIASQMVMKWARLGSENRISLTEDCTRLTLDTIALCAMDHRFNSFYSDVPHPMVSAMNTILIRANDLFRVGGRLKSLLPSYTNKFKKDVEYFKAIGDEMVRLRRESPTEKRDLLNAMIYVKDPKTGKTMSDDLIGANMRTFLIAGHETTSGLLSFAFANMLLNPTTFFKAQQEVDQVVGKKKIEVKHLNQLPYLSAVLKETLRLTPTAPAFARGVRPENKEEKVTIGGGKYEIPRDNAILCLLGKIHRDPKVWGDDANEFKPERMLDENFEKLPKNAWRPFGTGVRACIGRAFAWQESLLVTALLLQNFNLTLDDPNYKLQIQMALTIKPKDCFVRATLRPGVTASSLQRMLSGATTVATANEMNGRHRAKSQTAVQSMTIFFGSNTGTCQTLAQKLAQQADQQGYHANIADLDDAVENLPRDQPVVIVTASYEGQPPDNATRFIAWLESVKDSYNLKGVRFAVFGCGHSDWTSTFQRIPTLTDSRLADLGGTRLVQRGSSDAAKRDMFGDFEKWTDDVLWPALFSDSDMPSERLRKPKLPMMDIEVSTQQRASQLHQSLYWANVIESKVLTAPGEPEKRHTEFQLPSDMSYKAGDYLAILPLNPDENVRRVIKRFNLPWDAVITIPKGGGSPSLPIDTPISAFELFRGYVELSQPATLKDIELLIETTADSTDKEHLKSLTAAQTYEKTILAPRTSILDLLETHPSTAFPLSAFLSLLPPLRPRQYSISSSPLSSLQSASITYSIITAPTWSSPSRPFLGVTGTYLANLQKGDRALVSVRSTNKFFRLPVDMETTPLLLFCAGSGIAPFRAFLRERAVLRRDGGRTLAPALMFVGCRDPKADRLYAEEVDSWVRDGVVVVRYAFSRASERSEGCRYVQDRVTKEKKEVLRFWDMGAKVFTCGSSAFGKGVGRVVGQVILERARATGKAYSEEDVEAWISERRNERFVSDVFD